MTKEKGTIIEGNGQAVIGATVPTLKKARAALKEAIKAEQFAEDELEKLLEGTKEARAAVKLARQQRRQAEKDWDLAEQAAEG